MSHRFGARLGATLVFALTLQCATSATLFAHGGLRRQPSASAPRPARPTSTRPRPVGTQPLRTSSMNVRRPVGAPALGTRPIVHSAPVLSATPVVRSSAPAGRPVGVRPVIARPGVTVAQSATQWGRVLTTAPAAAPVVRGRGPLQRTARVRQLEVQPKGSASTSSTSGRARPGAPAPRGAVASGPGVVAKPDFVDAVLRTLPGLNGNPSHPGVAVTSSVNLARSRSGGYEPVQVHAVPGRKPSAANPIYDSVPPLSSGTSTQSNFGTYWKLPPPLSRVASRVDPSTIPADVRAGYTRPPAKVKADAVAVSSRPGRIVRTTRSNQLSSDVASAKGSQGGSGVIPPP